MNAPLRTIYFDTARNAQIVAAIAGFRDEVTLRLWGWIIDNAADGRQLPEHDELAKLIGVSSAKIRKSLDLLHHLGGLASGRASQRVFARHPPRRRETACFIYRHFDAAGALLYIGISLSAVQRLAQHRDKPWFDRIATVTVEPCENRADALARERDAIREERPLFNKIHAAG